jgi:3-phenylpropionate/trans-cinnamate dioxygenase ferredoxin subunit
MGEFVKVTKISDIPSGSVKGFIVNGNKIALGNVGGKFYAFEDKCSHQGQPLSNGILIGNIVMCLFHGAQFDVTTGQPLTMMGKTPIRTYEVRISGDEIEVKAD